MAEENVLSGLLNFGRELATPFAKSLVYGKDKSSEMELTKERAGMERLNGSGPSNPDLAVEQSSKNWFDFLYGDPAARGNAGGMTGAGFPMVAMFVLVGLLIFFVARR
jgi:hypothetical protein